METTAEPSAAAEIDEAKAGSVYNVPANGSTTETNLVVGTS